MSLSGSNTEIRVRAIAEITIGERTTRMASAWVKEWEVHGQYGTEERVKEAAKDLVKKYEEQWGPVHATIVSKREKSVVTTQTYTSRHTEVTCMTKAGRA
jgi:hypothetical protein